MALLSVNPAFPSTLASLAMPTLTRPRRRRAAAARAIGKSSIPLSITGTRSDQADASVAALPTADWTSPLVSEKEADSTRRGAVGDEVEDIRPNMANARRRSNSSTHNLKDFKTKFETIETEPVFEESIHGPMGEELEKQSTTSTENSIAEEDNAKKF
jgi:hypothetical protein